MPTYVVKLPDPKDGAAYWLAWSTITDSPLCNGMSLEEFLVWYLWTYIPGPVTVRAVREQLATADRHGVSCYPKYSGVPELIAANRAGENEIELTLEEILDKYCRRKETPNDQ